MSTAFVVVPTTLDTRYINDYCRDNNLNVAAISYGLPLLSLARFNSHYFYHIVLPDYSIIKRNPAEFYSSMITTFHYNSRIQYHLVRENVKFNIDQFININEFNDFCMEMEMKCLDLGPNIR